MGHLWANGSLWVLPLRPCLLLADFNENGFIDEEDLQRIVLRLLNSDDVSEDLLVDLTSHVCAGAVQAALGRADTQSPRLGQGGALRDGHMARGHFPPVFCPSSGIATSVYDSLPGSPGQRAKPPTPRVALTNPAGRWPTSSLAAKEYITSPLPHIFPAREHSGQGSWRDNAECDRT